MCAGYMRRAVLDHCHSLTNDIQRMATIKAGWQWYTDVGAPENRIRGSRGTCPDAPGQRHHTRYLDRYSPPTLRKYIM